MMAEPISLPYEYCLSITYRQAWDRHVFPALEQSKKFNQSVGEPGATFDGERKLRGGFDSTNATESEFNEFADRLCGGRKYTGGRFWIPGEVPGIVEYNGPEKTK